MKLKFTNIADNVATMLIYKHIGNDSEMGQGVDGNSFANEVLFINEYYSDLKAINVRINSVGGSVADGYSICSAMLNSKIPCNTYIDGMAYSMAGVIAMCGKKKYIADYATFMMHNANGGSDDEVLELITNSLATIFNAQSHLPVEFIRELMDRETWMNAEDARQLGFEIIKTNKSIPQTKNILELQNIYNKYITNIKPNMEKLTNLLKINNEASEDVIVEVVTELKNNAETATSENEALKSEIEELKAKLSAFEDIEKAKEEEAKEEEITNAITEGKISADSKEKWLNRGLKSSDLKDIFADLKTTPVHTPITNVIKDKAKETAEDRSDWTFSMWEKKDPNGLKDLMENNKVAFDNLLATIPTDIKSKK
jgi:ATP-dependent protease ClpP protease subunit/regulator of replication initiation timing